MDFESQDFQNLSRDMSRKKMRPFCKPFVNFFDREMLGTNVIALFLSIPEIKMLHHLRHQTTRLLVLEGSLLQFGELGPIFAPVKTGFIQRRN